MRQTEKSTRVYFIRHGKTDFPMDRIYCDQREDPTLSKIGLSQIANMAKLLANESIDVLFASPAARTMQTAKALAEPKKLQILPSEALRERPFGIWDGLYFHEIETDYPEEYLAWKTDPVHYTPNGGETIEQLYQRIQKEINRIIDENLGKSIAIVSHVGPIRLAITAAFDIPIDQYRQLRIDYASCSRVDYGKTRNNLIYSNKYYEFNML
ncbi:MAG: histidine phosphatase family protein [Gammaproteobacteria bacterium]|nr:histidine phosphatase family protein [Gammaproteobacteria bacterium]MDH5729559.1 histidine phosphatase family protein [Gammaproteobacteria bacterium]